MILKFQPINIFLGEGPRCYALVKKPEQEWVDSSSEASLPFLPRERRGGDVIFQSPSLLLTDLLLLLPK